MDIKKVSLIGLGAMGVFFAPRLQAALGDNFRVIAEGERKKRLEEKGVWVNGVNYHFPIVEPQEEGDPADLVIMAVKYPGLDKALADIKNQVGENTLILCVMNGVDSEERAAAVYGWNRVLYSYMRINIVMRDGVAKEFDPNGGHVVFGEAKNQELSPRVLAVKEVFDQAEIPYRIEPDMLRGLWFKFMCNVGENLTCALLGIPYGSFRVSEHANALRRAAMEEVMAVANAKGINLDKSDMERQEEAIKRITFHNKPSTLQDLEAGKKTEIEMFAGKMISLGQELGIPTPLNWMFYQGIRVLEEKNQGVFEG
ncbi:MAG TPA: ketopantoate reductase family protein [Candidatus Egerieimonas intestinavium]|uniref:2-dehydropantoate 2-reductase n=1 Tax=Candidatus Egerieimonas intestinavium TaxID=2840777 RepID=A0A9D1JHJ3_9FIRM|nr:ketopantoate reductase family protein [Candidatus Egerieimonas intestinavium]